MMAGTEHIGAAEAAQALGLERRGRRWGPCPACGSARADARRGPISCSGPTWACFKCGARGDGVNLISYVLTGAPKSYREAFAWLADRGKVEPAIQPVHEPIKARIPTAELMELLRACTPAAACRDADYLEHCRRKGVEPSRAPGGILPAPGHPVYGVTRSWWPGHRSRIYRIVLPMFDHRGRLAGMHVRATDPSAKPKARWPTGVDCSGLFFADQQGRRLLRGEHAGSLRVLMAEGFSDFFAASTHRGYDALLGIESGSAERLKLVAWPRGSEVYCATHADKAGDAYATKVEAAVAPAGVPTYRLALMRA